MELITRQSEANTAAAKWRRQYATRTTPLFDGRGTAEILAALEALGPTPDPDEVDRIIGHGGWTDVPRCDECSANGLPCVVQMGEPPDYESSAASLCLGCLRRAVSMAEGAGVPTDSTPHVK